MVMEASPSAAFEMAEPHLLLEFLIVTLDAPAQLGEVDQTPESDALRERREPIFGGFFLAFGPFNQQPFFRSALAALIVTARGTNMHTSKARGKKFCRAFSPFDRTPSTLGQAEREPLD